MLKKKVEYMVQVTEKAKKVKYILTYVTIFKYIFVILSNEMNECLYSTLQYKQI